MPVTSMPIPQSFLIIDIAGALLTFNRLRWFRSSSKDGEYLQATAAAAAPASLRGVLQSRALEGKVLSLRLNGSTLISHTFVGPDPVEGSDIVSELSAYSASLTASFDGTRITLGTVLTGSGASIEAVGGDALPYLGILTGSSNVGMSADSTLQAGVHEYIFNDQNSSPDFWYCTQMLHSTNPQVSPKSAPLHSRVIAGLPFSTLIGCYIRLVDLQGTPRSEQDLHVHNVFLPNSVTTQSIRWSIFRQYVSATTDESGYAQIYLIRGATVDITIGGSGFTRRVQIPTTGDLVDLLDPSLVVEDEFGIGHADVDFAIRTSF